MKIIGLSKEEIKLLEGLMDNVHVAKSGFKEACSSVYDAKNELWKRIKEITAEDIEVKELNWKNKEFVVEDIELEE